MKAVVHLIENGTYRRGTLVRGRHERAKITEPLSGGVKIMRARWSFSWEENEWLATRTPPADDNLRLAVETLLLSFTDIWQVNNLLEAWRNMELEHGTGYCLSSPSASVRRISHATMEIGDLYGQFEDVHLPVDEFLTLMTDLAAAIQSQRTSL